jgi:hypothetical protein
MLGGRELRLVVSVRGWRGQTTLPNEPIAVGGAKGFRGKCVWNKELRIVLKI